ncbi:MAG: broad specificity phosphatase PhoE [Pontimonas sp.]
MPAEFLHFVRHGEVHNPDRILYGRLDGFGLSERGTQMAGRAGSALATRPIRRIISSPLQRAVESATPLSELTEVSIDVDERLIEGLNTFQGTRLTPQRILRDPAVWKMFRNPWLPSWGEPYREIAQRMLDVAEDAWHSVDEGEVVLVTHQVAIWVLHRAVAGIPLPHLPQNRRCSLSSITTIKKVADKWKEESYREPAADLLEDAIDLGAV